jgi:PBSX family phage terminase large subunit
LSTPEIEIQVDQPGDLSPMEGTWRDFLPKDYDDATQLDTFEPNCDHQADFYNDEEHHNQCVIGGVGAGKTKIASRKVLKLMLKYPGIEVLATRTTGPTLRNITVPQFLAEMPEGLIRHRIDYPYVRITLVNGSIINFIAFDREAIEKTKSMNLGVVWLEEASMFKDDAWTWFVQRMRQMTGVAFDNFGRQYKSEIPHRFMILTTNAAGRNWVWEKFYENKDEDSEKWVCTSYCNKKHLPKDFFKELEKMTKRDFDRFVMGLTNPFEGSVFYMFDPAIHRLPDKYMNWVPPNYYQNYTGLDYGYQTPTTCIWFTVLRTGEIVFFNEYGMNMCTPKQNVRNILLINSQMMNRGMQMPGIGRIDPATKQHKGEGEEGKSVFEQIRDEAYRCRLETGQKNFMEGLLLGSRDQWGRIIKFSAILEPDKSRKIHPLTGEHREEGWPRAFFTPNCSNLMNEIKKWRWKDQSTGTKDPQEKPEERNDHYWDGASYGVIEYLRAPGLSPEEVMAIENSPGRLAQKARDLAISRMDKSRRSRRQGVY